MWASRHDPSLAPAAHAVVEELRREGIAIRPSAGLFEEADALFRNAQEAARRIWEEAKSNGPKPAGRDAVSADPYAGKEYKMRLLPERLPVDDPFVRVALHPQLLGIAQGYLGMRPLLRAIELWWDLPTEGPAKETQLWHRDGDDAMNLKVFAYFSDVGPGAGPFCFIPQTHPLGPHRAASPPHDAKGRSTDEQMGAAFSPAAWKVCTAPSGTVILCDTCGYHKGLKPSESDRLMLMIQYTSGIPRYPRTLTIEGAAAASLTPQQQQALC